uniref:Diacylglycerol kinase n=1 Tax=Ciona intestinalis TaxID=7719 RepID=F6XKK7_CIOIN
MLRHRAYDVACEPCEVQRTIKAIQKAGYNMNELVISTSGAMSPVAQRRTEPKAELDWTENALPNDHIWAPTNASGDLCYVGEQTCLFAYITPKSGPRKKCSACHIVVHDQCMPLLERIGFQCKVTFRESTSRSMRENLTVHHHWVHRRKQEGKCKQCSKSFDKRFGFRDTKIIAISCSWCKEAFHNKVSCFQIHKINEPCGLGMFFRSIVPPTWIVKASTKQKSIRNRSKKKRGSTGNWRKKSSKELKQRTFVVRPPSQQSAFITPILVFINPKSGGNQGAKLMQSFQWVMNPRQVVDLTKGGPQEALELYKKVPNLRILACGGDGTVGWILSVLDKLGISRPPPVAILPLGTGNDLSRTLNFGPGYTDESIQKIIQGVEEGRVVKLDRWKLHVERNECEQRINEEEESKATDKPPLDVVNNYFSIGSDAKVSLNFHESRGTEAKPNKFNSRIGNKIFYAKAGVSEYLTRQSKDMFKHITVVCDGKDITPKIRELKPVCMLFLNINRYSSGTTPWGHPTGTEFQAQRHDDKLIEVLAFSLNQLGMLFVGGHGERLCQCKSAYIKTDKTLPIQIDGEPCRLNPSNIRIEFFNQASMVYKTKRRPSVNPEHQQIKIRVNAVSSAQYDEYSGRTDKLCNIATPRLVTIVSNNSTLSSVRSSWEAVNPCERGPGVASEKWMFLDASRPDKLYLIDRTQENLHLICDVITTDREIYLMDMTIFIYSQRDGSPKGKVPIRRSSSSGSKREETSSTSKMFMDASKRGDVKKMCLAYEHGADLFIRDHDGSTALHHAARFSHLQVVQFMIEHGKTKVVNLLDNDRKQTALHKAAWYGRLDICRELVEAGASLAFTDYKGKTAIDRAKQSDSPDLVQYLTNAHHTANALNNCLETDL